MMYVISDLHGQYDKYMELLDKIEFSSNDTLYILGDIVDRGPKPFEILDHIMANKNIHLLRGNHEEMFIDYIDNGAFSIMMYNGGGATIKALSEREDSYAQKVYNYFKDLPTIIVCPKSKLILVHAGIMLPEGFNSMSIPELMEWQSEDFNLWTRSNIYSDEQYKEYKIVCGHTMTSTFYNNFTRPAEIIERQGHIFIDCGVCHPESNGRLGCLKVNGQNDFEKIYV